MPKRCRAASALAWSLAQTATSSTPGRSRQALRWFWAKKPQPIRPPRSRRLAVMAGPLGSAVAEDGVRDVGLLQRLDLVGAERDPERRDGVVEMLRLR